MGNKYKQNSQKKDFFDKIVQMPSMDDDACTLTSRCKFNFSYFVNDDCAGQDFCDWNHNELVKLLNKLKAYSKNSLKHWQQQYVKDYPVFAVYKDFPSTNTDFKEPTHIPHQAEWARFHVERMVRLIGFIIPADKHDTFHHKTGVRYDENTFYIVFLDRDHKFYKTKKR